MKDKVDVLKKGILVLLPEPDDRGRAIIYTNLSLMGEGDTAEKVCHSFALCLLVLLFERPHICYSLPILNTTDDSIVVAVVFNTLCNGKAKLSKGELGGLMGIALSFCFWYTDILFFLSTITIADPTKPVEWIRTLIQRPRR